MNNEQLSMIRSSVAITYFTACCCGTDEEESFRKSSIHCSTDLRRLQKSLDLFGRKCSWCSRLISRSSSGCFAGSGRSCHRLRCNLCHLLSVSIADLSRLHCMTVRLLSGFHLILCCFGCCVLLHLSCVLCNIRRFLCVNLRLILST